MGTTEKLKVAKELLAASFLQATEKSAAQGLQFRYKSQPCDDISFGKEIVAIKGWTFDVIVKEAGYGERTIQQFAYGRPDSVDAKNFELLVIQEVFSHLIQGALISWYEVAKFLASDIQMQHTIRDAKKGDFTANE